MAEGANAHRTAGPPPALAANREVLHDAQAVTSTDPERNEGESSRYRLLAEIGRGGMAHVYLALARGPGRFNKLIVLKMLRGELAKDEASRAMFFEEAQLSARLNHPNVVQVYEVLDDEETGPVIVMEYLEGESLDSLLAHPLAAQRLSMAQRLRIFSDVLAGLSHAHEQTDFDGSALGIVHRDVSPHNVHVTVDGQVKVLDFGIARAHGITADTASGAIRGKVRYMAPEQMVGDPVDQRADIYSAGVVLWELATLQRLWHNVPDVEVMNRIHNEGIPSACSVRPEVPESVVRIIAKAVSYEPSERYSTCVALQVDVDAALAELGEAVANRDIGKAVAELFAKRRLEKKQLIESLVSAGDRNSDVALARAQGLPNLADRFGRRRPDGSSSSTVARSERRPARGWSLLVAAALVVGLLGAVAFALLRSPAEAPHPQSALSVELQAHGLAQPAPAVAATSTAASTGARVQVRVRVVPRTSKVWLDDAALSGEATTAAKDDKQHVIRVEADGYQAFSTQVSFDEDVDLDVRLTRSPSTGRSAAPASAHSIAPPRALPPAREPRPLDSNAPW